METAVGTTGATLRTASLLLLEVELMETVEGGYCVQCCGKSLLLLEVELMETDVVPVEFRATAEGSRFYYWKWN